MTTITAFAAREAGAALEPITVNLGDLGPDQVEIAVSHCGICHSDLSMIDNDWDMAEYPLVPGHEVVGRVAAVGERVRHIVPGQTVGLGWFSSSCMTCNTCLSGDHNLCGEAEQTIVGRHGGFAERVRADALWAVPLPDVLDSAAMGPMFCGGITVFNPIIQNALKATDRVGVVGIGGLGHLALMFLRAWGCEVTAFSTTPDKEADARAFGAHHFVATHDPDALSGLAGAFRMILVTVNAPLNWDAYIQMLAPRGKLHLVGAVPEVSFAAFPTIIGQKSVGGSPLGSPATTAMMLEFSARHGIAPLTEVYPMSRVNDALDHLRSGKARFRIVLENDLG